MASKPRATAARKSPASAKSAAASKPSSASKKAPAKAVKAPAVNPFKKVAEAMSAPRAAVSKSSAPKAEAPAAAPSFASAAFGAAPFGQANDWLRSSTEGMQKIFGQSLPVALPDFSAFTKSLPDMTAFSKSLPSFGASQSPFASKSADAASRSMQELVTLSNDHMQAMSVCGTAVSKMAKDMGQEMLHAAKAIWAEQVELSKAALQCRNIDDVVELQTKASRIALDTVFTESKRLAELAIKHANGVAEPLQESVSGIAERITKLVAA